MTTEETVTPENAPAPAPAPKLTERDRHRLEQQLGRFLSKRARIVCLPPAPKFAKNDKGETVRVGREKGQPYRKPLLPKRNDKCPCGSGAKFKHCHGRG